MHFLELPISGAFRIDIEKIEDDRGFFARTFSLDAFRERNLATDFVQCSVSFNKRKGTLRGLHYQATPHAETKLIRCTRGAAFDVLVDLRRTSPTFRHWHAEEITTDNGRMIYIPAGCAHGFQTLSDATEIDYAITPAYVPDASRGIAYDDTELSIPWPIGDAILSQADRTRPRLADAADLA